MQNRKTDDSESDFAFNGKCAERLCEEYVSLLMRLSRPVIWLCAQYCQAEVDGSFRDLLPRHLTVQSLTH